MNELHTILDGITEAGRRPESVTLATVVGVVGSAYRRPGARLLLFPDGRSVGAISGGCLESDIAKRTLRKDMPTEPFVVRYDTTAEEEIAWELGLGCGGVVDVFVEQIDSIHPLPFLAFMKCCLEQRRPGVLARIVAADRNAHIPIGAWLTLAREGELADNLHNQKLASRIRRDAADVLRQGRSRHASYEEAEGAVEVFHELLRPSPALLICGAGHDAPAVARFAAELGWRVTVCDRRPTRANSERFPNAEVIVCRPPDLLRHFVPEPGAAAVVMTHDYLDDQCFLEALVPLPLRYIGILGSRRRTNSLLHSLTADGYRPSPRLACLHGPVGLDLGAETPEEIGLAVVAEIQAVLTGHDAGFLCDKPGPIHDRRVGEEIIVPPFEKSESLICPVRAE